MNQTEQNQSTDSNSRETLVADMQKLRELIQKYTDDSRYEETRQIIHSLIERQEYAKYHYQEYRRLIDNRGDIHKKVNLLLLDDSQNYWDKIAIKAHIQASMQSLHAVHDILAHLISFSLNIHFGNERRIKLNSVHENLKSEIELTSIESLLNELREHEDFRYVEANVNHSKHKYNIAPSINVNLRAEPIIECSFLPFSHHDKDYPKKDVDEFLLSEFGRELDLTIKIENEIINILEQRGESNEQA